MKTCPHCSAELRDPARFCSRCGAPQPEMPASGPADRTDAAPAPGGPAPAALRSRRPGAWIAGIATAAALLLLAAGMWWYSQPPQASPGAPAQAGLVPTGPSPQAISPGQPAETASVQASQPALAEQGFSAGETNLQTTPPPQATATITPTPQVLSWYGEGESFRVMIAAGEVIDGDALGSLRWKATGGRYDGKFLVVTFATSQTSGCASQVTYTYQVTEKGLWLIQQADGCGNVDTSGGKSYLFR